MTQSIVVTGSRGFLGRHIVEALSRKSGIRVVEYCRGSDWAAFAEELRTCSVIFHLAGVNRPVDPSEFMSGNAGLTNSLLEELNNRAQTPVLVFASSVQAENASPYGTSKRLAEEAISKWAGDTGGQARIFRLKNVFGKWSRPNYNTVVATFCHNIAHNIPIHITDRNRVLELVYVDDVVRAMIEAAEAPKETNPVEYCDVRPVYTTQLGAIADKILAFRSSRESCEIPAMDDEFTRKLYATYLSFIRPADFGYSLLKRTDARGTLAEFIKERGFGQIFVSRTYPGVTRGNHFHHTKAEKFFVIEGEAVIRFRSPHDGEITEFRVAGTDMRVVDIPPGYAHSIQNVGDRDLVTLFWVNEIFDPARPDTVARNVF